MTHAEIVKQLTSLHHELAQAREDELRARVSAYREFASEGVTHQRHMADIRAVDHTAERMRLEGEIAALNEQRDYLVFQLHREGLT